jgi:hypothetical protein
MAAVARPIAILLADMVGFTAGIGRDAAERDPRPRHSPFAEVDHVSSK